MIQYPYVINAYYSEAVEDPEEFIGTVTVEAVHRVTAVPEAGPFADYLAEAIAGLSGRESLRLSQNSLVVNDLGEEEYHLGSELVSRGNPNYPLAVMNELSKEYGITTTEADQPEEGEPG